MVPLSALSRRALAAASLAAATLAARGPGAGLGKKRRRGKRKRRPAPTCAQLCPDAAQRCYLRAEGRPFCGDTVVATGCVHCETDADCFGTANLPYCLLGLRERDTNEFRDFREPGSCPNQTVGICARAPVYL